jgi:hypothetical protein
MLVKISVVVVLANILGVVLAHPTPVYETNASRMARGLSPNPPAHFARDADATWGMSKSMTYFSVD